MSGGYCGREGGHSVVSADSDDALSNSGSSVTDWVNAVVTVEVNVDSSSNDVVKSVQRDLVIGVVVVRHSVGVGEVDNTHISKMSWDIRWNSVSVVSWVEVTSGGKPVGSSDVSEPVEVESVSVVNSHDLSHDSGSSSVLEQPDPSGDVASRRWLEVAVGNSECSSAVVGLSRSSEGGRVDDSNDSKSKSGSSISSVGGDAIIDVGVNNDGSSNNRVNSAQLQEIQSLVLIH